MVVADAPADTWKREAGVDVPMPSALVIVEVAVVEVAESVVPVIDPALDILNPPILRFPADVPPMTRLVASKSVVHIFAIRETEDPRCSVALFMSQFDPDFLKGWGA